MEACRTPIHLCFWCLRTAHTCGTSARYSRSSSPTYSPCLPSFLRSPNLSVRRHVDEGPNQAEEGLMLRSFRLAAQKIAEFDLRQSTARRRIWLMNDESLAV